MSKYKQRGFALLEVLIATVLLTGLLYAFIAFTQHQNKLINKSIAGKYIAMIVNTALEYNFNNQKCLTDKTSGTLSTCLSIYPSLISRLSASGLDPNTATLSIVSVKNYNDQALMTLTFKGAFNEIDASVYAQQILENLSPLAETHFSPSLYNKFFYYKVSTDATTLAFYLSFMKAGT